MIKTYFWSKMSQEWLNLEVSIEKDCAGMVDCASESTLITIFVATNARRLLFKQLF